MGEMGRRGEDCVKGGIPEEALGSCWFQLVLDIGLGEKGFFTSQSNFWDLPFWLL